MSPSAFQPAVKALHAISRRPAATAFIAGHLRPSQARSWTSIPSFSTSNSAHLLPRALAHKVTSRRYQSTSSKKATRPCPSCSAPLSPAVSPCPECSTLIPLPLGLSNHSLLSVCEPIPSSSSSSSSSASSSESSSGAASSSTFDIPAELARLPARGYDLSPRDLRNRMLARQRDLHPDKFGSGGEGVVGLAKELSGRVNMAYEVLADPLKRAEYIIDDTFLPGHRVDGVDGKKETRNQDPELILPKLSVHNLPMEETDSLTEPKLLMQIMEAREELEEATTEAEVDALRVANGEKVEATIVSLREAFSADPPDMKLAKDLAVQLRYWMGLEAAAKEWVPGKGAGLSAGSGFTHS